MEGQGEKQSLDDDMPLDDKEFSPGSDPERGLEPQNQEPSNPDSTNARDEERAFLVSFPPGDRDDPKNWNSYFKAWITLVFGALAFAGSAGTSIIVPAEGVLSEYLHVSTEVTVLLLSLYVLGTAICS